MLSIWFMHDNHTFTKVESRTRDGLVNEARRLFKKAGCGSLFVRDGQDANIKSLSLHARRLGNGEWGAMVDEIETWADEVVAEQEFRTLMA